MGFLSEKSVKKGEIQVGIERSAMQTALPGKASDSVSVPAQYRGYMDDVVRKIVARGNDAEIRSSKDGIKIFEVSKKVAAVIPAQPK